MSKFGDSLKKAHGNNQRPMGFRRQDKDTEVPALLLIADITSTTVKKVKELAGVPIDAAVIDANGANSEDFKKAVKNLNGIPLGLRALSLSSDVSAHLDAGADFIIVDLKSSPQKINREGLGKVLTVSPGLAPGMVKAINDLDMQIEAVHINNTGSTIDIEYLLACHLFGDLLNIPLLVNTGPVITEAELKGLNLAGVRSLILPPDISTDAVNEIKVQISKLPRSVRKKGRMPLIPGISMGGGVVSEEGGGEEEEEEEEE